MQQAVRSIKESDGNCWDGNSGWKPQQMAKVLIRSFAFFFLMFLWHCFNIPWSSIHEKFLKSSKQNAGFPFGHTEINSSLFTMTTPNSTFESLFWKVLRLKPVSVTGKQKGNRLMLFRKGSIQQKIAFKFLLTERHWYSGALT